MRHSFKATYEDGVLRPLEALPLSNMQHVRITVLGLESPSENEDEGVVAYFEPAEWAASKENPISRAEVWTATASIRGSLSDSIIAAREERF